MNMTTDNGNTVKITCPECGRKMEVGKDTITNDYYVQCRNQRCAFDGWHSETIAGVLLKAAEYV